MSGPLKAKSIGTTAVQGQGLKPLNIAQARRRFEELTGRNITVIADDSFLRESKDS